MLFVPSWGKGKKADRAELGVRGFGGRSRSRDSKGSTLSGLKEGGRRSRSQMRRTSTAREKGEKHQCFNRGGGTMRTNQEKTFEIRGKFIVWGGKKVKGPIAREKVAPRSPHPVPGKRAQGGEKEHHIERFGHAGKSKGAR